MQVGRLCADLDDIEAQIAEEEYKLVPDDEEIKKKAEELRRRAEESAARALEAAEERPTSNGSRRWRRRRHITISPGRSTPTLPLMPPKRRNATG